MVIKPLDLKTSKLLGSTGSIVSPRDIVKELIDNSIDAGATNIHTYISSNCLDKIRVQDNGNGIDPQDFGHLAMPSHTSKLDCVSQLDQIGSQSLGFRGLALASINAIATVEIITRSAYSPVATKLTIRSGLGGFSVKNVVSAPKGTSVMVTDVFQNIPVRRQHQLKQTSKILLQIRELLKSYAIARINIGFSFKIFDDSGFPWRCVPSTPPSLKENAIQIFGKELGATCKEHQFICRLSCDDGKAVERKCILHALLPDLAGTFDGLPKAAYFSVDGRAITTTRGFGKTLYESFKSHVAQGIAGRGITSLQKPFICLNILTSNAPYDVNISPMKDEILLSDEEVIKDGFNRLCANTFAFSERPMADTAGTNVGSSNNHSLSKSTVKLRTGFAVNMKWKNDEEATKSDEEGEEIEILIPDFSASPKSTKISSPPEPSTRRYRQIDDYFGFKSDSFHILSENNESEVCEPTSPSSPLTEAGRKALQPLTASWINCLQEEDDYEMENSDSGEESQASSQSQLQVASGFQDMIMETPIRYVRATPELLVGSARRAERITLHAAPLLQSPPPSVARSRTMSQDFLPANPNTPIRVSRAPIFTGPSSGSLPQHLVTPVRQTQLITTPRARSPPVGPGRHANQLESDSYLTPVHTQARQTQLILMRSPPLRSTSDACESSDSSSVGGDATDEVLRSARTFKMVSAVICTDMSDIRMQMRKAAICDVFVQNGRVAFGMRSYRPEVMAELETKLRSIVRPRL